MARVRLPQQRTEWAGRPGYHDPTAHIGGAEPGLSALTLRLWLAGLGVLMCTAAAAVLTVAGGPKVAIGIFAAAALVGLVDFFVILRRKRGGEPG